MGERSEVPVEHRRAVARWLIERGDQFQQSWVLGAEQAQMIRGALYGAAVDLVDPDSEDTTVEHAAEVVAELRRG